MHCAVGVVCLLILLWFCWFSGLAYVGLVILCGFTWFLVVCGVRT